MKTGMLGGQNKSTIDPPDVGSPIIGNHPSSAVDNILSTGSPLTPETGPAASRKDVPQPGGSMK